MRYCFVFLFFYFAICFAKPLELDINAKNAILIDADTKTVLFEKNSTEKVFPASITKVITLWYALENYQDKLNSYCQATSNALKTIDSSQKVSSNYQIAPYVLENDGTSFDLIVGERLKLNDLLFGMMITSGNDASNVVAENLGSGSIEKFIKDLNNFLHFKGLKDTNLANPHGLHIPTHVTTAKDIAYITQMAIKNPKFFEIFTCRAFTRPKTNKQEKKDITTFNRLLKSGKNYYSKAIGGKTGYHAHAKYNLVSIAKQDDRTLIAVVLGCRSSDQRYIDSKKLYEAAFQEKKISKKIIDSENEFLAKVEGGSKVLKAKLQNDLIAQYYPSDESSLNVDIHWDNLDLPIKQGQKVATLVVKSNDFEIQKEDLVAANDVKKSFFYFIRNFRINR